MKIIAVVADASYIVWRPWLGVGCRLRVWQNQIHNNNRRHRHYINEWATIYYVECMWNVLSGQTRRKPILWHFYLKAGMRLTVTFCWHLFSFRFVFFFCARWDKIASGKLSFIKVLSRCAYGASVCDSVANLHHTTYSVSWSLQSATCNDASALPNGTVILSFNHHLNLSAPPGIAHDKLLLPFAIAFLLADFYILSLSRPPILSLPLSLISFALKLKTEKFNALPSKYRVNREPYSMLPSWGRTANRKVPRRKSGFRIMR